MTERRDPLAFFLDKSDPDAWKAIGALSTAAKAAGQNAGLNTELVELVNLRVSQINGCTFCLDLHTRRASKAGVTAQRLGMLAAWRDAGEVYSEQERAALDLAEAVTTLPDQEQRQTSQVLAHGELTDEQYSAVQWIAITMNATNRISIMSHHPVRRRSN